MSVHVHAGIFIIYLPFAFVVTPVLSRIKQILKIILLLHKLYFQLSFTS